jgi:hypothetical protein
MATPPPPPVQVEEEEEEDVKIVTPEASTRLVIPRHHRRAMGLR